jgi:glycosyltransferase involved in cell wall biosynthesis
MTSRHNLFVVSHSAMGGVQEIWADLAEGFIEKGHHVKLVALYPHAQSMPRTSGTLPWTFVVDRKPATFSAKMRLFFAFARMIWQDRPERIFSAMPAANVLAPLLAWLSCAGTRVILSHHSPIGTHNSILNAIDGLAGSLTNVVAIVAVSNAVAASLSEKNGCYRSKCIVVPNALPPRIEILLETLAAKRASNVSTGRIVVAAGRLAHQKNYAVLIRATALMPNVRVRIIGAGPLEAELKSQAAAYGVADRVDFLGEQSRADTLKLLSTSDVFTQPSLYEGHSLALIEAAKLNLPLVVSNVPVQVEGITTGEGVQCGIAVPTTDDRMLAEAIIRLIDDPVHYRDYSDRAGRLAAEATYDKMLERYLSF